MGPLVTAAASVGLVVLSLGFVVVQPRRAWRDAAEHSKLFWSGWATASVLVGAAPLSTGLGWAQVAWLGICCCFGALQPAMFADIVDVHRHAALGMRARVASHRAAQRAVVRDADERRPSEPAAIQWRARRGP